MNAVIQSPDSGRPGVIKLVVAMVY